MDDTEQPVDLPNLQPVKIRTIPKIARACSGCVYSHKEGNDLVCRQSPPQVTFLVVPVPVTVGTPNGPQVRQGMQAVPHTSFPIVRPELWCGAFEPKT